MNVATLERKGHGTFLSLNLGLFDLELIEASTLAKRSRNRHTIRKRQLCLEGTVCRKA